jgi:histidinol-phosphate/aromatic aminotransferase/cobyric acid decarboxylase-like protein
VVAVALGLAPDMVLDLSQSLNPVAPDLRATIARHIDAIGRYPDVARATEALADCMGVAREEVLLTNGGAEAIALVTTELGGRVEEPEFSLLPRSSDRTAPLWRSDPNNPSGLLAGPRACADVWDEAYYPIATGRWTDVRRPLVVGSLTKLFACPGLRVGYVRAEADLLRRLQERKPAWSVNGLVAEALPEMLEEADLPEWSRSSARLRAELASVLESHGLRTRESDANWLLVERPGLREELAQHGIIVRDCTSFAMPGVYRMAVPDEDGIARVDDALRLLTG